MADNNDVSMGEPPTADGWADVQEAAATMFSVWMGGSELEFAKEAWGHLHAAGLARQETIVEATAGKLRLATLARVYEEFCGHAWQENKETPIEWLVEGLDVDPVAVGILAQFYGGHFADVSDDDELRQTALNAVKDGQRAEVYRCLRTAYGGDAQLYARLWHTSGLPADTDEGSEFEATFTNAAAYAYVMSGFEP